MTKSVCELYGTQEELLRLASDPQTAKSVLKRLLLKDVEEVQMAAAENPSTDWMALWEYLRLYPLKEEGLSREIRKRILKKQNIPKEMEMYITYEFVDLKQTTPREVLEKLAEMPVKNEVLYYSPKVSLKVLEALAEMPVKDAHWYYPLSKKVSPEGLEAPETQLEAPETRHEAPVTSQRREKLYQEYMRKHIIIEWIPTVDATSLKKIADIEKDEDILKAVLMAKRASLMTKLRVRFKFLRKKLLARN